MSMSGGGTVSTASTTPEHARVDVLGVGISAIDMEQAVATLEAWIAAGERHYVCVTGVHGVMESHRDPELRAIHNAAGMVTPDGMPLVALCRRLGHPLTQRVYGPDLLLAGCARSLALGWRHYFYGGADGVADLLARRLSERFPGLIVAGTCSPPFREVTTSEDEATVARINATHPDIVWVGLSTPKQERWMAAHVGRVEAAALIGVGAAFDFHAGRKRQAPRWMMGIGLEWLFRLVNEPRRLWRRYLLNNPAFVVLVGRQLLSRRRLRPRTPIY
jgi:N-acetylglucosaminyldiphosphoundecaprenol N-acetyl-beta-D-mannosaminyltransferase